MERKIYRWAVQFRNEIAVQTPSWKDWDLVSYPTLTGDQDNPSIPRSIVAITPTSEHKEQAFQVISLMLSDEYQLERSKKGVGSVLMDPSIHEAFASNVSALANKNKLAFFTPTQPTSLKLFLN